MADQKISDDTSVAANAVVDTDSLPGLFGNANKRLTWANLKAALLAGLATFTSTTNGIVPASGGGTTKFLRADGAFAVPPSGGGGGTAVVRHPGYRSGSWYRQGRFGTGGATATSTGLNAIPFIVEGGVAITAFKLRVGAGVAGTSLKWALYANNAGTPGDKIAGSEVQFATTSSSADSIQTLASTLNLADGVYWAGSMADGTTATIVPIGPGDAQANALVGSSDGITVLNGISFAATVAPSFASGMPSTFPAGAPSTAQPAMVWFKAA